jgi:primosomal protein N' (replication factor Y)
MVYVEVILPVPVGEYYTYGVGPELENDVAVGKRVVVPFGAKKFYTGIIRAVGNSKPEGYEVKDIALVLDDKPILDKDHLDFQEWISSYYMSSPGDVLKAALPAGLRIESQTKVYVKSTEFSFKDLKPRELAVYDILNNSSGVTIQALNEATGLKNSMSYVRSLMDKGIVGVEECLRDRYKQKEEKYIKLAKDFKEEEMVEVIESMRRAPKQQKLLMLYLNLSKTFVDNEPEKVSKSELMKMADTSHSILKSLITKNILCEYSEVVSRLDVYEGELKPLNTLNKYQQKSLDEVETQFEEKDCVLLHGVTSSGKTEIYIHLIEKCINQGKQVLYLLPEIALTSQIIRRLRSFFGDAAGVYHSKFSDSERVEVWTNLRKDGNEKPFKIILGVRSSLFLPFDNLGLIIVDEEHENTYKQHDPAPRYHARDAALMLARLHGAKTLLGSATPSIESYYNAEKGKYGFSALKKRYSDILMPEIKIADMGEARRKKIMKGVFTPLLYNSIEDSLSNGKQVILFQNRRGYASFMECRDCGYVVRCKHCDVSLTYHKYENKLSCHYCGYRVDVPHKCPACESENISTKGFGTEKIEMELNKYFPDAKVARLDHDTTRTRKGMDAVIHDFENRKVDILVGTQMVSKGLDFDNVAVVGIMNADSMLNYPDFRAFERSYQLMAQVSGRAGRHGERGKVVIQTATPEHPVVCDVVGNDYESMFYRQIEERREFIYPPFFKMVEITIRYKDRNLVYEFANKLGKNLRKTFGIRVFGPQAPLVGRVHGNYLLKIILKIEINRSLARAKFLLKNEVDSLLEEKTYKRIFVGYDVDCI